MSEIVSVLSATVVKTWIRRQLFVFFNILFNITLIFGCGYSKEDRVKALSDYSNSGLAVSTEFQKAIIAGQVLLGMCPTEAHLAAGQFFYVITPDRSKWPDNYYPPQVIFSQCNNPDSSKIKLTFNNKTQYGTKQPATFAVYFENGKAVKIEKYEQSLEP